MEKIASSETPQNTSQPGTMQALTLSEHFNELRKRLLIIVIGLVVGVLVSFAFAERAIQFLAEPIGGLLSLQSIEVTENMGVFMKVALLSGFILSLPLTLYEIIAYIVPGLKPRNVNGCLFPFQLFSSCLWLGWSFLIGLCCQRRCLS